MKRFIILLLSIGIALSLPDVALARKIGSLTVVQGTVDLIPAGKAAHAARQGEAVQVGDSVRTRKEGRAEITFEDGTIVRVARSTEMAINRFLIGDQKTDAQLTLPRGKIQSIVPKKVGQIFGQREANRFEVKTPIATCGVRGTNFFTYHQDGISGATFQEGQGYLYNNNMPDQVSTIAAGQSGTISGPGALPQVRPATPEEMKEHGKDTGSGNGNGAVSGDAGLAYAPPPPPADAPPAPTVPPPSSTTPTVNVYIPPTIIEPESETSGNGTQDVPAAGVYRTVSVSIAGTFDGSGSIAGENPGTQVQLPDADNKAPTSDITISGTHNSALAGAWQATLLAEGANFSAKGWVNGTWTETIANHTGDIDGTMTGAWVDINQAVTGVLGGEVRGSFTASNWTAETTGVLMNTTVFLEKMATEAGRTQLAELNIPNIEIGRANLTMSGASGVFTEAHMNDVTFFASRSGETAKIWATGDVGGTVLSNPGGQSVDISGLGGAITANITMQTWDTANNKWAASVTAGQATQLLKAGSPVGVSLDFQGNAAGQITTPTTFSGTGSGTAAPR
jgi:hypothetical protein